MRVSNFEMGGLENGTKLALSFVPGLFFLFFLHRDDCDAAERLKVFCIVSKDHRHSVVQAYHELQGIP